MRAVISIRDSLRSPLLNHRRPHPPARHPLPSKRPSPLPLVKLRDRPRRAALASTLDTPMSSPDSPQHTPPPRPRIAPSFFVIPQIRGRWAPAIRAALAFGLPAATLYLIGFDRDALLAALGGFAVLYGEKRPYRVRWRAIATAAAVLVAVAAAYGWLGEWADNLGGFGPNLVVVAALVVGAGAAVFGLNAMRLGPPGPFFFVLTAGICTVVVRHGVAPTTLVVATAAGAAGALIVGMAPALWRPHGPEAAATAAAMAAVDNYLAGNRSADPGRRHGAAMSTLHAWGTLHDAAGIDTELAQQLWESQHRLHGARPGPFAPPLGRPGVLRRLRLAARPHSHATVTTVRVMLTAGVAGVVSLAVGLSRPDWAILGTVLILQLGPDRIRGVMRGAHRMAGTILGLGVYALIHLVDLTVPALILVIAVLNLLIELTIVDNYSVAVTFITPLAMLMGNAESDITVAMRDRLLETVLGAVLAIAALWWLLPHAHRRTWRRATDDVLDETGITLDRGERTGAASTDTLPARLDLQWSLLEAEMAATDSATDEPRWAHQRWPRHLTICQIGYDTLTACWQTDPGDPLDPAVRRDLERRREEAAE
ncbi:FUSC family protein [Gordonia sinesedis]